MFKIEDTTITLTRGDTLDVVVEIMDGDKAYVLQDGDSVRFALKRRVFSGSNYYELADPEPLITKVIPNDTLELILEPEDTKDLKFGDYLYDIDNTNGRSEAGAAVGQYSSIGATTLFAVGNGTSHTARSNAFEVLNDGSLAIKSPDGKRWKVSVSNTGALTTTAL